MTTYEQLSPEMKTYLSSVLDDAGGKDLDTETRKKLIVDLSVELNKFIGEVIVQCMPVKYLKEYTRLIEQNRPHAEIERFVAAKIPNWPKLFAEIFEEFRTLCEIRTR